jgi:hypothetical protein
MHDTPLSKIGSRDALRGYYSRFGCTWATAALTRIAAYSSVSRWRAVLSSRQ